ncbi:Major outer membrane protein [Campylobacter majalis]|uniref:Major outer membrane protein n=1 Tax=Campylobacter majalis TaxID=2790656 RepID=A0ABM8Q267_9BACT|nr:major outer membrane protein [Campylobacter majalis]CAD7286882.1 Major outer membrane protein [Campylobacter majalis]
MKIAKLSLAALVALGAFTSMASATPLEEAIKDVDVSGMARYRYTYNSGKESGKKIHDGKHNFKIITNFKAAIDDNFFGVIGLRYNANDLSSKGNNGIGGETNVDKHFALHQAYLGYTVGNTTITAGKQVLGTYFTDDLIGTGVKIVNSDVEGLTLAALYADALENTAEVDGGLIPTANTKFYKTGNLYGVAAIGSYDPIGFQLWYASLDKVVDLIAVEFNTDIALNDDVAFSFVAQYVNSDADKKAKDTFKTTDGNFYATELGTSLFGADLSAGYIGWKAKNKGTTSFTLEDQGSLIDPGEQFADVADYTLIEGRGNFWFVTAGYTYDKFFVGADYVQGTIKEENKKRNVKESVARLGYDYSKKLKFTTWYSYLTDKEKGGEKDKNHRYRFEAKYSF